MNVFAFLLSLAAATAPYSNDLPPEKYQGNPPPSVIIIVDNTNSKNTCGVAQPGWRLMACEFNKKGTPVLLMPNPCIYPEAQKDPYSYAHLLCHEFGHANGWNATHDN
jgi:hypothetical protein